MLFLRSRVVLLAVLALVGCMVALAQEDPAETIPADGTGAAMPDPVLKLWRGMFEAGMIDDVQYQHVLQHGRLPGGGLVQNSPLSEDRQEVWAQLSENNLVTPEELANMLFKGEIPNMAAWELKAFEELAPVYEPERRKSLTQDLRRKHQKVKLIRMAHSLRETATEQRLEAERYAEKYNLPISGQTEDGRRFELQAIEGGLPVYDVTCNATAANTISTAALHPAATNGFSLEGSNVTVGVWDEGLVRTTHRELLGRVVQHDTNSVGEHATAVAGTIAASGVSAAAKGMAPNAGLISRDWTLKFPELAQEAALGLLVSNHSYEKAAGWQYGWIVVWYGDIAISADESHLFGLYDGLCTNIDSFVYEAQYHLPVWAAGNQKDDNAQATQPRAHYSWSNGVYTIYRTVHDQYDGGEDGYDSLSGYAVAKNCLVVGAVKDIPAGYGGTTDVVMEAYSSCGPTDDGRIKPDIVANGESLYTTDSGYDANYMTVSGTSFSTPSVAGSLALLVGLAQDHYGTNFTYLASTLKALVLHTADEAGDSVGPDYRFGWGLMNTHRAAQVLQDNAETNSLPHIKEVALLDGDTIEFPALASASNTLKVTIGWTDPVAPLHPNTLDPTNLCLINDLDLRVISPDGSATNLPWILDPVSPSNAATTGDNIRDNIEQVVVASPSNDWYTVVVTHKGSLSNGVQDVSIVITGNIATNAPAPDITDIVRPSTNSLDIEVEWPAVVGGLYEVLTTPDLMSTNAWSTSGVISANAPDIIWRDEAAASTNSLRFYRIKRIW
jgi:hypothetical protein